MLRAPSGGAESVFSLVETNAFKQLTHLALRCRPGNDAAIKQARRCSADPDSSALHLLYAARAAIARC